MERWRGRLQNLALAMLISAVGVGAGPVFAPAADAGPAAPRQTRESCSPLVGTYTSYSQDNYSKANYRYCLQVEDRDDGAVDVTAVIYLDGFYFWGSFWYWEEWIQVQATVHLSTASFGETLTLRGTGDGKIVASAERTGVPAAEKYTADFYGVKKMCGYWDRYCNGGADIYMEEARVEVMGTGASGHEQDR